MSQSEWLYTPHASPTQHQAARTKLGSIKRQCMREIKDAQVERIKAESNARKIIKSSPQNRSAAKNYALVAMIAARYAESLQKQVHNIEMTEQAMKSASITREIKKALKQSSKEIAAWRRHKDLVSTHELWESMARNHDHVQLETTLLQRAVGTHDAQDVDDYFAQIAASAGVDIACEEQASSDTAEIEARIYLKPSQNEGELLI